MARSFFFFLVVWALALVSTVSRGEPTSRANLERNGIRTDEITAQPNLRTRTDRERPLPDTDTVKVKGRVEDLFGTFRFSNRIPSQPHFKVGEDPIKAELALMEKLIDRVKKKKIPAEEAYLAITRYHIADQRVMDRIKAAMDAGIKIDVITDLNDSVEVQFEKGEESISDFKSERVKPNKSPNGRFLQQLLDLGFEYGVGKDHPRYGIYSQPVFKKHDDEGQKLNKIFDIMHEKSIVAAQIRDGETLWAEATAGSANMVAHGASAKAAKDEDILTRVNIVREIKNQELAKKRMAHVMALKENFAAGNPIDKMAVENFLRVETANGWVETGFTNGRNNLNDRIAALLLHGTPGMKTEHVRQHYDKGVESYYDRVASEFAGWEVEEIREMEFVNTFGQGREAEKHLFEGNPKVKKLGLYDAKFNEVRGWGFPPTQVGVDLLRAMGGTVFPLKKDIADRMKTLFYLRGIDHIKETDLDGPPLGRFLLHTKLYMIRGKLADGTPVTVIFDGSLNKSNHKENAEDQDMIVIRGKSELADSYWAIPEELAKAEPQYFNEGSLGLFRDVFARMTGRSPLEIDKKTGLKLRALLSRGKLDELKAELERIADEPTTLSHKPTRRQVQEFIDKYDAFLHWHKGEFPHLYGRDENFYLNRVLEVPIILSNRSISPNQAARALKGMMWKRDAPGDEAQEAKARRAWEILGMGEFPELKRDDDASAKVIPIDQKRNGSGAKPCGPPTRKVAAGKR